MASGSGMIRPKGFVWFVSYHTHADLLSKRWSFTPERGVALSAAVDSYTKDIEQTHGV